MENITLPLPEDVSIRWMTYHPTRETAWAALLTPEERTRASGFKHDGRRRMFTLGRAAARTLLAERLGLAPVEVPLHVAEDGGVDVLGAAVRVSISHTEEHAVAAVAEREVGVDLERIAPRHPRLPGFLLHPEEYAVFEALPLDRAQALMLYWTLKEATLKALRTGFRRSPKDIQLAVDLAAGTGLAHIKEDAPMHLCFTERGPYYLAVAFAQ